jgi:uncharacterized protein YgbK (DUF1537 family)
VADVTVVDGLAPVRAVSAEDVAARARRAPTLVVLDDDPTGTQTVADVPIVTTTDAEDLDWATEQAGAGFFVLTNTRSLDETEAAARTVRALAALPANAPVSVVSRGDSTLRGHFPLETDVLASELASRFGRRVDGMVLVPAYIDAGRVTIDSVHYARGADGLVPVGETEFAADATFGYASSDLREWIEEKTRGRMRAADVARITLDDIRLGGISRVVSILASLRDGRAAVADAVCDDDLRVLALASMEAEDAGATLVFRSGPSYVRARLGQEPRPPLSQSQIRQVLDACGAGGGHGLVVIGSHVATTTRQLEHLLEERSPALVTLARTDETIEQVSGALSSRTTVLATSRTVERGGSADESLAIARGVSAAVVDVVRGAVARTRPRWVVAKGGITSSDVATEALGVRRAWARGAMEPGIISLWEPAEGTAHRVPLVVFAGNVGTDDSLVRVVSALEEAA